MGEPLLDSLSGLVGFDTPDWLNTIGDPLGIFPGSAPKAPTAHGLGGLTPEQQALIMSSGANPSAQPGSGLPPSMQPQPAPALPSGRTPLGGPPAPAPAGGGYITDYRPGEGATTSAPSAPVNPADYLNPFGSGSSGTPAAAQPTAPTMPSGQAGFGIGLASTQPVFGFGATAPPSAPAAAPAAAQPVAMSTAPAATGPSLRDVALEGYYAGPRDAPQASGARLNRGGVRDVTGAQIDTSYMQPGQQVVSQGLGTAQTGLGYTADAIGDAGRARNQQSQHTRRLTNAADGNAPSVAEHQLRAGMAQGLQNNLALAASARGSGSGAVLAQRQAQDANVSLGARTNAQAAQLRAGEMAQARGELGQHLGAVRGGDLATAGLGTQVGGLGANIAGVGAGLVGTGAQLGTAQAGLLQNANLANQGMDLSVGMANLNAATQTQLANLNAQMTQQGLDDQQKMQHLSAVLGIDGRTQQGQQQLAQLLMQMQLTTEATNAGISLGNAQSQTNQQNGMIAGAASFLPLLL